MNYSKSWSILTLLSFSVVLTNSFPSPSHSIERRRRDVNPFQDKLIQITNPKPVVDTLNEAEKCCNNVQHVIGKKFVDTYDKVTGVVSSAVQLPGQAKLNSWSKVVEVLDRIGGKLVGLQ